MSVMSEKNGGAAPSGVPLRITVTSDMICPFCFIGLRKLEKALASSPSIASGFFEPQIRFKPYQLDPTLSRDHAVDKRERYFAKFGPNFPRMEEMMKARGKEVGINFSYGGKLRSTLDSHRLMEAAYARGGWRMQLAFLNELMPAYFEEAQDPGDHAVLASLAVRAGVFEHEKLAMDFLSGDAMKHEVEEGCKLAVSKGITGVPHFELEAAVAASDGHSQTLARAEVPGAQEVETIVAIIEKMTEKTKTNIAAKLAAVAAANESKANGAGATKCECCWKKVFGGRGSNQ